MLYGDRLRKIREKENLKQSDIANILNVDRTGYSQYEREYAIMPVRHLNILCNYFNISLDYVFNFTN